jgi:hypothetical protein
MVIRIPINSEKAYSKAIKVAAAVTGKSLAQIPSPSTPGISIPTFVLSRTSDVVLHLFLHDAYKKLNSMFH